MSILRLQSDLSCRPWNPLSSGPMGGCVLGESGRIDAEIVCTYYIGGVNFS